MPQTSPSRSASRPAPGTARRWRLGTRRSPLAMAQAMEVRARLCAAHHLAEEAVELVPITAGGDRIQDRPLADIGGKALWTKELDRLLLAGEIDIAVHSAKDVETFRPGALTIAAVPEREDVRDVLIRADGMTGGMTDTAGSIAALPHGARIGTSAPRRAAQWLHWRPDCTIVPFRGNVATRLARLAAGEADATLLAFAGLNRLGLCPPVADGGLCPPVAEGGQHGIGTALDPEIWLPAPGQGAIAVEARTDDTEALALLAAIDHTPSHAALSAERALLAGLGGTCHSAVAVMTRLEEKTLHLTALLFSPDGAQRIEGEGRFTPGDTTGPTALATDLLTRAPESIARYFGAGS